jgi:hypothetical protein
MNRQSSAIKELNRLAYQRQRERYPDVPDSYFPPHRYLDYSANGLTKCVLAWLKFNGHQAERISVTGRRIDQRQTFTDVLGQRRQVGTVKWIASSMQRGSADISAIIKGIPVKIEIKFGDDRQSDYQRTYQAEVERSGGIYLIVGTFQEFLDWYRQKFGK